MSKNLEQLINKSLVAPEERGGGMRYSMLETIRQYARELFDAQEGSQARAQRHFFYSDALSEKLYDAYRSSDAGPTVWRAEEDVENFRAAVEWGQEKHVEETCAWPRNYCIATGAPGLMSEGVEAAKNAVERARLLPPVPGEAGLARQKLIARALFAQGMVGMGVGDLHAVLQALQEAIDLARGISATSRCWATAWACITPPRISLGAPPDVAAAELGDGYFQAVSDGPFRAGHGDFEHGEGFNCQGRRSRNANVFWKAPGDHVLNPSFVPGRFVLNGHGHG